MYYLHKEVSEEEDTIPEDEIPSFVLGKLEELKVKYFYRPNKYTQQTRLFISEDQSGSLMSLDEDVEVSLHLAEDYAESSLGGVPYSILIR